MLLTATAALLVSLAPKRGIPLTWAIAAFWIAAALASGFRLILSQSVPIAVAFAEAAVLATAFLLLTSRIQPRRLLPPVILALALFGMVHILKREDLAGLIPAILPYREAWPLLTGSTMLAAAAAIPFDRTRIYALATVALMFLAWVPIVHAPRILARPDAGEVIFAATDVALIGALILAMRVQRRAA